MKGSDVMAGMSSAHFQFRSLDEAFEKVQEWGFDLIEFFCTSRDLKECRKIAELSDKHDTIVSYHCPFRDEFDFGLVDTETGSAALCSVLESVYEMTGEFLVVHMGTFDEDRQKSLDNFTKIIENNIALCERYSITVAIEDNTRCHDERPLGDCLADFQRFFRRIDSLHLGMNMDVGHANVTGHIEDYLLALSEKMVYCHVDDNNGKEDQHLGAGMGTVDWQNVVQRLNAISFHGPYVVEFPEKYLEDCWPMVQQLILERAKLTGGRHDYGM